ncbi:MAG: WYL domain-containing protein [Desulfobulbaceae bacterium]|nr:WYL domain-containing protein [Desulfobulbaceae bacterium]
MPKATNHNALARLLEILKHLPSKGPGYTARELSEWLGQNGYEVSKRTVERDLTELACHFPLMCNDKSAPYGWHWLQGDGPDLPCLTVAEALSLTLVEDLLRPLLPGAILESLEPRFRQAQKKLTALAETNPKARWAEKVRQVSPSLPLLPPEIAVGALETVQEALLADVQLEVAYQRPGAEEAQGLRLHPLGLVQRGPVTYLVATVFAYTDIRIFAVHRIHQAQKVNEPARRPKGFSLDDYIGQGALEFGNGKSIKLVALVSEGLAAILAETPLSSDQNLKQVGEEFRLTATVNDTWQLHWWILSQGKGITVLKPVGLRREIVDALEESLKKYMKGNQVSI